MTQKSEDLAPVAAEAAPAQPPAPSKKAGRKRKMWPLVLTAVVMFSGGAASAAALVDPTRSDEYTALALAKETADSKLTTLEADYAGLQQDYGVMSDGMKAREAAVEKREAAAAKADETNKASEAAVKAREDAVTGAEKTKAANTVGEGTWVVGTDLAPGTYRTAKPVGANCYWGVYRSGSNGSDILENDIPGGGHPVVTLAEGQDFKSSRCGTWEKQ